MPGRAATIHVPGDLPTIQAAIDVATSGDEIVLADGVFGGAGNRDLDYGGRAITIRSASGNPAFTTIDCGGSAGDPHRGFVFGSGEGADAVLEGVTVSGGFAPGLPESRGGGVICTNGSSPTFRACVFSSSSAKFGGAVYCDGGGSPTFDRCAFAGNHAADGTGLGQGGAVAFPGATPRFLECSFRGNVADLSGGALWGGAPGEVGGALSFFRVGIDLIRCVFEGNSAGTGGAVKITECSAALSGCVFEGNVAHRSGGAVDANQDAHVGFDACTFLSNEARGTHPLHGGGAVHCAGRRTSFTGCLFAENAAPNGGGVYRTEHSYLGLTSCTLVGQRGAAVGFYGTGQDTLRHTIIAFTKSGPAIACVANLLTVECCDLFGNAGGDSICGIDGGGNFSLDPRFCDAAGGDFTIRSDSPCAPPGPTGCGAVGALPVGCGSVGLTPETWARVKHRYR